MTYDIRHMTLDLTIIPIPHGREESREDMDSGLSAGGRTFRPE